MSTTQTPDLDAIAQDAQRRLTELHEQEARLSLDALGDGPDADAAKAELIDFESEIAACESALRRATLADDERERREQAAKADAEQAAKAKLIAQADKLAARLPAAGRRIDETARALAVAVKEHREIAQRELGLRIEAGTMRSTSTVGRPYTGAVLWAFHSAGVGNALEAVRMGPPGPRPMCEPTDK
jgi:hypothetical protein